MCTSCVPTPPTTPVFSGGIAVACGGYHTCVLSSSGGVHCWGQDSSRQLGRETPDNYPVYSPPLVPVMTGVAQVTAGSAHTCVLSVTGGVSCWGSNSHGQLGTGRSPSPYNDDDDSGWFPYTDDWLKLGEEPTVVLAGVASVTAGQYHTCALTLDGSVLCWGDNWSGQVGNGVGYGGDVYQPGSVSRTLSQSRTYEVSPTRSGNLNPVNNTVAVAVGVSVGGVVAIAVAAIACAYVRRRKRHNREPDQDDDARYTEMQSL